ncbi:MAG TPA: cytochrome P450 [Actinocrinis sp.]|jgi:cytochrome P450|uniref:cytochrome P450 n=1 Tax=Actinocrinis sp. TaxID=1920516 RepID=UPI002DDD6A21|nr:cytochrome P450 [Actinocrinis sp.]HEV3173280.1 cytochrome P450 [Actinocrinis sp.]
MKSLNPLKSALIEVTGYALPSSAGHAGSPRLPTGRIGGHLLPFRRDPLAFLDAARHHGGAVPMRLGPRNALLLTDPALAAQVLTADYGHFHKGQGLQSARTLLGDGLLLSEGDTHRCQRKLVQPAFQPRRIEQYGPIVTDSAQRLMADWKPGDSLDLSQQMTALTLIVVARSLFASVIDDQVAQLSAAMDVMMASFGRHLSPLAPLLFRLPLPATRRYNEAAQTLDRNIRDLIDRRAGDANPSGDLLGDLIAAHEGAATMSPTQLRDEVMTLLVAGHETTANALAWTLYQVTAHPHVDARLAEEIRATVGDGLPTAQDLGRMPYLRQVIEESLRLIPPVWLISRRSLQEQQIGEHSAPRDTLVLISQYVMHRDERWFPDPTVFDPDRWALAAHIDRPRFAYIPFGAGHRVCVGASFANIELGLVLASLLARWRFRLQPGFTPRIQPLITLRPAHGIPVTVEARV